MFSVLPVLWEIFFFILNEKYETILQSAFKSYYLCIEEKGLRAFFVVIILPVFLTPKKKRHRMKRKRAENATKNLRSFVSSYAFKP